MLYNTNGYERKETLKMLAPYVDIYLTDFKYYSNEVAKRLSDVPDYFEVTTSALEQMLQNQPQNVFDENGLIKKGVIVRHLVLPNHSDDSVKIIKHLYEKFGNQILLSIMSQYVPMHLNENFQDINRTLKPLEYNRVVKCVRSLGFDGFVQELSSSYPSYIPNFNLEGVKNKND